MRKAITIAIVFVLFSLLTVGIVTYLFFEPNIGFEKGSIAAPGVQKIAIVAVLYNSTQNTLNAYVQARNQLAENATFTNATIRNSNGNVVETVAISNVLTGLELTRIKIPLNNTLPSGDYSLYLTTTVGATFSSLTITVP